MEESNKERSAISFVPLLVAFVLIALPMAYVGSYLGMVDRNDAAWFTYAGSSDTYYEPQYSLEGDAVHMLFAPINFLDRKLRPGYWKLVPVTSLTLEDSWDNLDFQDLQPQLQPAEAPPAQ